MGYQTSDASCGLKTARAMLFLLNCIFLLIGLLLIGIGIWHRIDPTIFLLMRAVTSTLSADYPAIAAYIFIATGGFVLLVAIFGCLGAARKSPVLLGLYIVFVLLAIGGELASGIIAMQSIQNMDWILVNTFEKTMTSKNIDPVINKNQTLGPIMNWCQDAFLCCGYYGPLDYNSSALSVFGEDYPVPPTCCLSFDGDPFNANYSMVANWTLCRDEALAWRSGNNSFIPLELYTDGCQYDIENWVLGRTAILVGIALGSASIELFLIIYAFCLCMTARDPGSD